MALPRLLLQGSGTPALGGRTPPWENQPWLTTSEGQTGTDWDVVLPLAIPWRQVSPLDLKELRKPTRKHPYLTPPCLPQSLQRQPLCLWRLP